ncbi:MAG TPA: hypothetical protein VLA72_10855, partial [Anaerolineales bacterium]|nr:hypothetical protein [Anaerolineales bacterium]
MDNIIKILAGFEETAYKILMLVIIIPKTLLKIIFDPVGARDYIEKKLNPPENEESKTESQRTPPFTEYFSPVLLLLTVALVPALLLSFLPETGVSITSSAIQEGSTQYEFRGEAAFSSSAQGKGYEFRWEVRNQTENSVIAVIHTDTDPGKGGIQYDDNKATDIYIYDFDKEGNYLVKVTVKDPYGYVLFTDSKSVSVSPKDSKTENSTELKVNVTNPDGISFERKQLNIDSLSNVLKKDTTIFLAFSMLLPPLFFAFVYSLATKKQINEQEMRKIFYVECYYFSPLSAAIWIFYYSLFFLTEGTLDLTGAALHFVPPLLALTWFVSVETNALADESDEDNITRLSALFIVVACIIVVMVVGLIVSVSIADASIRDSVRDFVITIYLLISFGLVGIYFVNWRKARKSTIPEKKTIAKDQKTKISPRIKWIGGGALFIILCCISVVAYSVISTDLQSPSAAPVEATTPSNSEYREEFDGENIDWQQMEINGDPNNPNQVKWSIENGRANVTFTPEKDQYLSAYYIYTAETYYNVQVETKALSNKNNSNTVSLICRYNEAAGWYEFEVSKSGDYNIYQVVSENDAVTYNVLVSGSSLLVEMGRENIYTAICKGNNLSLYINKSQVATATDPDAKFKNGMIGVAVYSPESQDVNVQFDYVVISEPRSQPNLVNLGATATPTPIPLVSVTEQFDVELSRWNVFGDQEQVKVDPANNNKLDFQLIEKDGQYPAITLVNNVGSYSDVQMDVKITNNDSASY